MTSQGLPDYDSPPVVEVAIGAQYLPLERFRAAHVGLYWGTVKEEFPQLDERPPLPHNRLDLENPINPRQIRLELSDRPDLPRSWFISESGGRLLQLQRDRFVMNWRKTADDDEYPRYPAIKGDFIRLWEAYADFLSENEIGSPSLDLLELTYVNFIPQGDGWEDMGQVGEVFMPLNWSTRSDFLPVPKTLSTAWVFMLPKHAGQLSVELRPVAPENEPLRLRLSLTVTGAPADLEDTGAFANWFDLAREWIVRGFADLVGPVTDGIWGKRT